MQFARLARRCRTRRRDGRRQPRHAAVDRDGRHPPALRAARHPRRRSRAAAAPVPGARSLGSRRSGRPGPRASGAHAGSGRRVQRARDARRRRGRCRRERDRRPIAPTMEISARRSAPRAGTTSRSAHYHVYAEVAPNVFYSGSIDYTSVNTWGELNEERDAGFGARDSSSTTSRRRRTRFIALPPSRPLVDLPTIIARGLTAAEVDERFAPRSSRARGGIDDKIVRLVIRDLPRHIARELDHKAMREYKRRALQLPSRHAPARDAPPASAHGAPGRRPSLAEIVRDKLRGAPLDADIDRDVLVERATARTSTKPAARRRGAAALRRGVDAAQQPPPHEFPPARRHPHRVRDGHHGHHRPERLGQVDDARGDRVGAVRHAGGARHARIDPLVRAPARARREGGARLRARRPSLPRRRAV